MRILSHGIAFSLYIAAAAAATATQQTTQAQRMSREPLTFVDPQAGVQVRAGELFRIDLPSNASTGYQWRLSQPLDVARLKLVKSDYVPRETPGIVGAGGKQTWLFEALGKGKTTIRLEYVRSWEKDAPPAKTAAFEVSVNGETLQGDDATTAAAKRTEKRPNQKAPKKIKKNGGR